MDKKLVGSSSPDSVVKSARVFVILSVRRKLPSKAPLRFEI